MYLSWQEKSSFDERTRGVDSSTRSPLYKIETNITSFGTLGGLDLVDYYSIQPGVGSFTLYLTSDPLNGFTNPESAATYLVKITDSLGGTILTSELLDIYTRGISFESSSNAVFYVEIESVRAQPFSYAATIQRNPVGIPGDDFASSTSTTGAIAINQTVNGTINAPGDVDWFRINLTANTTYRFDLGGLGSAKGSLADPTLQLLNSVGTPITGDDDTGQGQDALLIYTPTVSGIYYLAAQSYDYGLIGTYQLSAAIGGQAQGGPLSSTFTNIMRTNPSGVSQQVFMQEWNAKITAGLASTSEGVAKIVQLADASTSVATLAYQFFTGHVPSQGGLDYLVSPTGVNQNSLNSAYYQFFNLENRYINFSVNLGKFGEGQGKFQAEYGGLTLLDATRKAYATIFGSTPNDAKVHALVDPRADYFAYYGQDGINGIGTKAAMVGWLLAEAVKADVGTYVTANTAFLTDMADGTVNYAVDIVGVYGGTPYFG